MQMLKRSKYLFPKFVFLTVLMFVLASAPAGAAVTYGFVNISNNNAIDAAIGEAQLFVDVTSASGGSQALFTFRNTGPAASSICDVYYDDGPLLGIASIDNSDPGVSFSQLASPGNLPSANNANPPFVTTAGFSADSDSPVQPNGVNPSESLGILFDLQGGHTYSDVENALASGALRIGLHVQGYASGGSESFVHVPIPPSVLLLGSGLIGLVGFRRKKIAK